MRTEVQDVLKRRDTLVILGEQINDALQEAQARSAKALPSFEEYGWSRLDIFAKRLRDALDDPLAEEVRRILEKAGLLLDLATIKDAIREKRQKMLEIARQIVAELAEVKETEVRKRALDDIGTLLKRGQWDNGISRSKEWGNFSARYGQLKQEPTNEIRILALNDMLDQGPDSSVLTQYNTMKKQAIALGSTELWEIFTRGSYKTLNDAKNSLYELSASKAEIEQVRGEKFNLDGLFGKESSMGTIQEGLQAEIGQCRKQLSQKLTEVDLLLSRVNNLSRLAEEDQEGTKQLNSLKEATDHHVYLQKRLEQLRLKIQQSLKDDAINLAESLAQKRFPSDWTDARILEALKELLEKYSFRLEV